MLYEPEPWFAKSYHLISAAIDHFQEEDMLVLLPDTVQYHCVKDF